MWYYISTFKKELMKLRNESGEEIFNEKTVGLIRYLREHGRTPSKVLVELLGIKPRAVLKHVDLARKFGYTIESHAGNINNGYELVEEKFTDEELEEIKKCIRPELFEKLERIINRV